MSKIIKANPVDKYLKKDKAQETTQEAETVQATLKVPAHRERKTQRVQLVMLPSLHKRISKVADLTGESFNNMIHIGMEEYLRHIEAHFEKELKEASKKE